jgi:6-pyruvoyltetrahydropterin/6-carboxytetrahydropterin synthase
MYRIAKEFTFAMGHRLSLHLGNCQNFHGHNYTVIVGVKSEKLNSGGMVIDFANLKNVVMPILNTMDHALMINETDEILVEKMKEILPLLKIIKVPYEPTAENMSSDIYHHLEHILKSKWGVDIDYVTVFETDTSQATYSLD